MLLSVLILLLFIAKYNFFNIVIFSIAYVVLRSWILTKTYVTLIFR